MTQKSKIQDLKTYHTMNYFEVWNKKLFEVDLDSNY
jgi:hypothetical protein